LAVVWETGRVAVLREVARGRLWSARPTIVVRDTPELVALYFGPGAPWQRACGPDGKRLALPLGDWELRDIGWPTSCLRLHQPGASHDLLIFWTPDHGRLSHFYVNLQTPLRRTPLGFDYTDQYLDLVVSADRSEWRWDDEDELEEGLARGLIGAERAAELRREGERARDMILGRHPPYDASWELWCPDPAWPTPTLPPGWDVL
jgi:hypothetical protein